MLFQQKRIRSLKRLRAIKKGSTIVVGARLVPDLMPRLQRIGFPADATIGDALLPADVGPVTRFNSDGGEVVHRDRPMETAFRTREWTWQEWHGRDTEERSNFVDVPYKRYPRTKIPPPGLELNIGVTADGQRVLVTPPLTFEGIDDAQALHAINLMLEVMGFCRVYSQNLDEIIHAPLRRLNWRLLPSGHRTWQQLRPEIAAVIKRAPHGNQPVIEHRLEAVNGYGPDFVAIGQAGFAGYVVFGFTRRNLFVFESIYAGNATYVFGDQWENLSRLTKMQVLENDFHVARILHRKDWVHRIGALLRNAPNKPR